MWRFFDSVQGKVRCVFYKLEPVQNATADGIFQCLHDNFSSDGPLTYAHLGLMVQMLCWDHEIQSFHVSEASNLI